MKMSYCYYVHVRDLLHELQLDLVIGIDVVLPWVVSRRLHCYCFDFVVTSAAAVVVALVAAARHLLAADDGQERGGGVSPLVLS